MKYKEIKIKYHLNKKNELILKWDIGKKPISTWLFFQILQRLTEQIVGKLTRDFIQLKGGDDNGTM